MSDPKPDDPPPPNLDQLSVAVQAARDKLFEAITAFNQAVGTWMFDRGWDAGWSSGWDRAMAEVAEQAAKKNQAA